MVRAPLAFYDVLHEALVADKQHVQGDDDSNLQRDERDHLANPSLENRLCGVEQKATDHHRAEGDDDRE